MSAIRSSRRAFARELCLGLLAATGVGLASSFVLVFLVLLLPVAAAAEGSGNGGLLLSGGGGAIGYAPLQDTDVQLTVSGMIVRAQVRQRFRNPHDGWVEGVYVFPLPEDAAVDRLRIVVGDRLVEGEIRERSAARTGYRKARAQGRRASLVEQERPNVFTTSVANIGPGETLVVELEYQQHLRFVDGGFALRFPTVVAPRYVPGHALEPGAAPVASAGWAAPTDRVPDAHRISPPVLPPGEAARGSLRLRVDLDAGFPLVELGSPYHPVRIRRHDARRATVLLEPGAVADRDFVLRWRPAPGSEPRTALFRQRRGQQEYLLAMLLPPAAEGLARRLPPRELVLVVDTSGSMAGASIDQARKALAVALERLRPEDRFNVIRFDSRTEALFAEPQPAHRENLARAQRYVAGLRAEGGTEMLPAIARALAGRPAPGHLCQVLFVTDGAIGNEREVFALVRERLGDGRLFTVGIGSAPNGHFMARAARFGRGTFTFIGRGDEVAQRMGSLLRRLEAPALTDIRLHWSGEVNAEVWPRRLPDLYLGEPVVFSARLAHVPDALSVSGRFGGRPWRMDLALREAREAPGVAVLWARRKIAALLDGAADGGDRQAVREGVVQVALEHRLVTRYTSLVAVDRTPVRSPETVLRSGQVPINLPAGWEYEKVFGSLPQTATDSFWHLALGLLLLLLGAALAGALRGAAP